MRAGRTMNIVRGTVLTTLTRTIGILATLSACANGHSKSEPDASTAQPKNAGPDASVAPDARLACVRTDRGEPGGCKPMSQTGCPSGAKCTAQPTGSASYETACAGNGFVPIGGDCSFDNACDADTCVAGSYCDKGSCREICTMAPDSCASGTSCVPFANLFTEYDNTGICLPRCDPMGHNCGDATGCWLIVRSGASWCDNPAAGGIGKRQGDACQFANDCGLGYGCILNESPTNSEQQECAFFCDPFESGGPTCEDGPGAEFTCVQISTFYNNAQDVDPRLGMCVDPNEWPQ